MMLMNLPRLQRLRALVATLPLACSVGVPPFGQSFATGSETTSSTENGSSSGMDPVGGTDDTGSGSSGGPSPPDVGLPRPGTPAPVCGNGTLEPTEACDDGNLTDADGCEADCSRPDRGNDIVDPGEWCHQAQTVPLAGPVSHVIAADLAGSGPETLIVAAPTANRLYTILPTSILPTSGSPEVQEWYAGAAPRRLAAGDLTGDGLVDLVVLGPDGLRLVTNVGGAPGPAQSYYPQSAVDAFGLAHMNLDGRLDLVVTHPSWHFLPGQSPMPDYGVRVLVGDGSGGLTAISFQTIPGPAEDLTVVGMDTDGLPDMVVSTPSPAVIRVLKGSKVGHVDPGSEAPTGPLSGLAAAHADDDGAPDIVAALALSAKLTIRTGDGSGGLHGPTFVNLASNPTALAAGDINDDGITDLAVATESGDLELLEGLGQAQYVTRQVVALATPAATLVVADLNGDGISDVAAGMPATNGVDLVLSHP